MVHTYSFEINQLKTTIETKLTHTYLKKFIKKPLINKDEIYIFNNLYSFADTSWANKEKLITTIFLIDIALSTHESIPNRQTDGQMEETELQLSVLAGDYYSSQYYYILSQLEDVQMISLLANAIKITSENKMHLFYGNFDSIHEYFDVMKDTEAVFYDVIATELDQTQLTPIIKEYLLINKLIMEKELINQGNQSSLLSYIEVTERNVDKSAVFSIINLQIDKCLTEIDKLLLTLPYKYADIKLFLTDKLNLNYQSKSSIAEEG